MLILRQKAFIFQIDTRNTSAGSSTDTQFKCPLVVGGTYNCRAYWGDGTYSDITAYDQAEVTHTYAVAGIYTVRITGTLVGWAFDNAGDKLKIVYVSNPGKLETGSNAGAFYGCENMLWRTLRFPNIGNMANCLRNCYELNQNIHLSNSSENTQYGFYGCSKQNSPINLDLPEATDLTNLLSHLDIFNSVITISAPKATLLIGAFGVCPLFNQPLDNCYFPMAVDMSYFLFNSTSFDQDLSSLLITHVTNMDYFLYGATLSVANFSATIIAWQAQSHQINVPVNFGGSKLAAESAADVALISLVVDDGWTIIFGGYA
jgi:hypothetical protein